MTRMKRTLSLWLSTGTGISLPAGIRRVMCIAFPRKERHSSYTTRACARSIPSLLDQTERFTPPPSAVSLHLHPPRLQPRPAPRQIRRRRRSEEHTPELQSPYELVYSLLHKK